MCDLLWSDPEDINGWSLLPRGAGFLFSGDAVRQFAGANDVDLIVTVWSAPNYCYRCGNVASILKLDDTLCQEYRVFAHAPADVQSAPIERPAAEYFL